jgi:hypothetical protein
VVVGGWTIPEASPNYFTVIKFDGPSGAERWRRIIPTPSNCCLSGVNAIDAAGDVVAAGSVQDNEGSHFTVIKLRGADGEDFGGGTCQGKGSRRVRGRVVLARHRSRALPGVAMTLTGPDGCRDTVATSVAGRYVFRQLGGGMYTLTPTRRGCTFVPATRTVTLERRGGAKLLQFRATCVVMEEGERGGHNVP